MRILFIACIVLAILVGGFFILNSYIYNEKQGDNTNLPEESDLTGLSLGELGTSLDVSLSPIEIIEDSRCPIDVTCIQAGTVRVRTLVSSGSESKDEVFTLNTPIVTETETITLTEVSPAPRSTITIAPTDYRFTFTIEKK